MDKETALRKIKSCLRLAGSNSPGEAVIALRQAKGLMRKYGINQLQVDKSELHQESVKAGKRIRPWKRRLAAIIADAFGCYPLVTIDGSRSFTFIGPGKAPEIAAYALDVCIRLCNNDRERYLLYIEGGRSHCMRQGNLFSESWVAGVESALAAFEEEAKAYTPETSKTLHMYLKQHYPKIVNRYITGRPKEDEMSDEELATWFAGLQAGESANLHVPVQGDETKLGGMLNEKD